MGLFNNLFGSGSRGVRAPTTVAREPKYVEVDWKGHAGESRQSVKVISLNDFADVEGILEFLRDRNTILVMKVKPQLVQEKMELKRALKRIQRTTTAIGGDIAGIREDIILITPPEIGISRAAGVITSPLEEGEAF